MPHEIKEDKNGLREVTASRLKYYHLEQMSDTHWWMALDTTDVNMHINVGSMKANCEAILHNENSAPEKPFYEIRHNDDESLDEIVACHPRSFKIEREEKGWRITLITKEKHELVVTLSVKKGSLSPGRVDIENVSPEHRCVMCPR